MLGARRGAATVFPRHSELLTLCVCVLEITRGKQKTAQLRSGITILLWLDQQRAQLIQNVNGHEHDGECEGIASGSDDCGQDEQNHYRVPAVFLEKIPMQNTKLA